MARRGVFAEIQHQVRVAQREKQRAQVAAVREHGAALRRTEQARKAAERAKAQAARATEAERKHLEKEAKAAHVEAMQAEVEERNAGLAEIYDEIDSLLAATLDVDDYVDLETLRRTVEHPEFDRTDLESPIPAPEPIPEPVEPGFHAASATPRDRSVERNGWLRRPRQQPTTTRCTLPGRRRWRPCPPAARQPPIVTLPQNGTGFEALEKEQARYDAECAARDAEVAEHNTAIDALITNLGYGTVDAVQEYVSIVLSNSVYPTHFEVDHGFTFDPATAELRLRTLVPGPDTGPNVKTYRYVKASDEITSTALSQKASKDRYAGAVHQVALRSMHEVFEADRRRFGPHHLVRGRNRDDPPGHRQEYVHPVCCSRSRARHVHRIRSVRGRSISDT